MRREVGETNYIALSPGEIGDPMSEWPGDGVGRGEGRSEDRDGGKDCS